MVKIERKLIKYFDLDSDKNNRIKIKDKLVILTLLILIISFFIFFIISSKNRENDLKEYYKKSINGQVIGLSRTRSGELIIRLKNNNDKPILSGISFVNKKYFEIGDSISKPSYSESLYLFKKDKSKQIENYFYIDNFDKYDWKK